MLPTYSAFAFDPHPTEISELQFGFYSNRHILFSSSFESRVERICDPRNSLKSGPDFMFTNCASAVPPVRPNNVKPSGGPARKDDDNKYFGRYKLW
jgi:hypothetical protein